MSREDPPVEAVPQRLDADAVCERCGTVNPEETLLCKTCGNNLRDQRLRRVAAGGLQAIPEARERTRWLGMLLTVFGILLILWTMFNVDNIETWLVQGFKVAQSGGGPDPEALWQSSGTKIYDELAQELDANPITEAEIGQALQQGPVAGKLAGRYFLREPGALRDTVIGSALVRREGDTIYFVARIGPNAEVRGEAFLKGATSLETRVAGARVNGEFLDVFGSAVRNKEGGYACYGLVGPNDEEYSGSAYPVP